MALFCKPCREWVQVQTHRWSEFICEVNHGSGCWQLFFSGQYYQIMGYILKKKNNPITKDYAPFHNEFEFEENLNLKRKECDPKAWEDTWRRQTLTQRCVVWFPFHRAPVFQRCRPFFIPPAACFNFFPHSVVRHTHTKSVHVCVCNNVCTLTLQFILMSNSCLWSVCVSAWWAEHRNTQTHSAASVTVTHWQLCLFVLHVCVWLVSNDMQMLACFFGSGRSANR